MVFPEKPQVDRRFFGTYPQAIAVVVLIRNADTVPWIKVFREVSAFFTARGPVVSESPMQAVRVTK
jgi:hypothetical protein